MTSPRTPDRIDRVEVYTIRIPRDVPYLGPLRDGTTVNSGGYFVRPGNKSVYSIHDQSVIVKVTSASGAEGWGECVGFVSPGTAAHIIADLAGPMIIGRDPHDVAAIYDDLYNSMRVRGFFGGFFGDALAAIDIALWDLKGQLTGLSVASMLGANRTASIPAYVSGLPAATRAERAALAAEWVEKGFSAVKFAAAVADDGELREMESIRDAIGPDPQILVDLHWRYSAGRAISVISELERLDLYLAEAPCAPEDVEGHALVARSVKTPVALGEELRTPYEYLPRFEARAMSIIQPEMGRMGITSFWRSCVLASAFHCEVIPHASIGLGLFQAASLQVTAGLDNAPYHEYQHSIFDRNLAFLEGDMACREGSFQVPTGPGIGVRPNDELGSIAIDVVTVTG